MESVEIACESGYARVRAYLRVERIPWDAERNGKDGKLTRVRDSPPNDHFSTRTNECGSIEIPLKKNLGRGGAKRG